jgi:hypothetical protein
MECKFLSNGIALQYHNFLKPCCTWRADDAWIQEHNIKKADLIGWHNHKDLVNARESLAQGIWPKNCQDCQTVESQNRQDSIRLGGISAYGHYQEGDITLEIRPGNVCNFACQTCWPFASTRVETYYKKANLPNAYADIPQNNFINYEFLNLIADRLRSINVLGGEPFYDPKCLEFLHWAKNNTSAELLAFTNGSVVDLDLISSINRKFTLVFSLDAISVPAEYIRFGTKWETVWNNYQKVKMVPHVITRVNITTSPYNYLYFPDLLDLLIDDWPEVVSFGCTMEKFFNEKVVPMSLRPKIIDRLEDTIEKLKKANIEAGQKSNAVNAVQSIVENLKSTPYDRELHQQFIDFVRKMDDVKNINFVDYCTEISELLTVEIS